MCIMVLYTIDLNSGKIWLLMFENHKCFGLYCICTYFLPGCCIVLMGVLLANQLCSRGNIVLTCKSDCCLAQSSFPTIHLKKIISCSAIMWRIYAVLSLFVPTVRDSRKSESGPQLEMLFIAQQFFLPKSIKTTKLKLKNYFRVIFSPLNTQHCHTKER